LFQEITIQLEAFPKFRGDSQVLDLGLSRCILPLLCIEKKQTNIATVEYEGGQHFIKDVDYNYEEEEQIKLMYKAVYQLNDQKALDLGSKVIMKYQNTRVSEVNAGWMNRIKRKLKK
jgi:RNA polymerase sigma-70 factor (ECF subfamily)